VICSKKQVPGSGSKIHYPVPNLGNWYPFIALLMEKLMKVCGEIQYCKED